MTLYEPLQHMIVPQRLTDSTALLYLYNFLDRRDYQYTNLGSTDLTAGLLS